jgi:hypothetical protein
MTEDSAQGQEGISSLFCLCSFHASPWPSTLLSASMESGAKPSQQALIISTLWMREKSLHVHLSDTRERTACCGNTDKRPLVCYLFFERDSCYPAQAGCHVLGSGDSLTLAFQEPLSTATVPLPGKVHILRQSNEPL